MADNTRSESLAYWKLHRQPAQSDTVDLPFVSNGVKVLAAGDVHFLTEGGDEDTITVSAEMVASGPYMIEAQIKRIYDTGTTVTNANMRIGA